MLLTYIFWCRHGTDDLKTVEQMAIYKDNELKTIANRMLFPFSEKHYELLANRRKQLSPIDANDKNGFNFGRLLRNLWKYAVG